MLKRLLSAKSISALVIVLFMILLSGIAVAEEVEEVKTIKGMIASTSPVTRKVVLQDVAGNEIILTAGVSVNMKEMIKGDQVIMECRNQIIESFKKQ